MFLVLSPSAHHSVRKVVRRRRSSSKNMKKRNHWKLGKKKKKLCTNCGLCYVGSRATRKRSKEWIKEKDFKWKLTNQWWEGEDKGFELQTLNYLMWEELTYSTNTVKYSQKRETRHQRTWRRKRIPSFSTIAQQLHILQHLPPPPPPPLFIQKL